MKIIKIAMNVGYGCWVFPNGEIFDVSKYEHSEYAKMIVRDKFPEREITPNDSGDVYNDFLLDNGFVRVNYSTLTIQYRGQLTPKAKVSVFKIINNDENDRIYINNDSSDTNTSGSVNKIQARRFINGIK